MSRDKERFSLPVLEVLAFLKSVWLAGEWHVRQGTFAKGAMQRDPSCWQHHARKGLQLHLSFCWEVALAFFNYTFLGLLYWDLANLFDIHAMIFCFFSFLYFGHKRSSFVSWLLLHTQTQ